MTIRIALADDQVLVRAGFRLIIQTEPDMEVVGEAGDGREAVALVEREHPDVILMDIRMPNLDGIEATRRITSLPGPPFTRVVILTTYDLDEYVFDGLGAGASGFLLKHAPPTARHPCRGGRGCSPGALGHPSPHRGVRTEAQGPDRSQART